MFLRKTNTASTTAAVTIVAFTSALMLTGCGHTRIVTSDPKAEIYVNGQLKGFGIASITKRGVPKSAHVVVKSDSGSVRRTLERKFTGWTFLCGLFTYMTGFIWAWEYPDAIVIQVEKSNRSHTGPKSSWDKAPPGSKWEAPPSGWE